MKKGLATARPSIKIAGVQEGTRTLFYGAWGLGRPKTINSELPPRLLRKTKGGRDYYYYASRGAGRKEYPLGVSLEIALEQYKLITAREDIELAKRRQESNDEKKRRYHVYLYRKVLRSANVRKIEFSLSEADVLTLLDRAGMKCEVSGIAFSDEPVDGLRIKPWAPSIDRINPARGYSLDNCRIVCSAVNLALNQFGDDLFYTIAFNVVKMRRESAR